MSGSGGVNTTKIGLIAGIIIAVILAAAFIGWGLLETAKYQRQADNNSHNYSEYTRNKIANTCVGLPHLEKTKCSYEATDKQREYRTNQRDLVAQKTSALWAYIMGAAAVIGMGLSVIGVFLVWTTFQEAHRQANIAEMALSEEREARKQSNRPWVTISGTISNGVAWGYPKPTAGNAEIEPNDQLYFGFFPNFKNIGNRVARNVWFDVQCVVFDGANPSVEKCLAEMRAGDIHVESHGYHIAPDDTLKLSDRTIFLSQEDIIENVQSPWTINKFTIQVIVRAIYYSIHGIEKFESVKVFWVRCAPNDFALGQSVELQNMKFSEYAHMTKMT